MSGELVVMVEDYLRVRRSLGYKLDSVEYLLFAFVDYLHARDTETVSIEHAVAFAMAPPGASPRWQGLRLSAVRGFARWAHTFDPAVQVPPTRLLPLRVTRAAPYLYTDLEVAALIDAADQLRPAIRAATFHTLLALMSATGIRTGEALGLDLSDLDAEAGTLTVTGKYAKTRMLPLHPTVLEGLTTYLGVRSHYVPAGRCPALLVSTAGTRLTSHTAEWTFRRLSERAGLTAPASSARRPRLHDFRHTFAVSTMLDAYRSGADPRVVLPVLSTWLGHRRPAETYWYLTCTTELLNAAMDRVATPSRDVGGRGERS
jgi:integrase/recombinase XerD